MPNDENTGAKIVNVAGLKRVYDSLTKQVKVTDPTTLGWTLNAQINSAAGDDLGKILQGDTRLYAVLKAPIYIKSGSTIDIKNDAKSNYKFTACRYNNNGDSFTGSKYYSLSNSELTIGDAGTTNGEGWYRIAIKPLDGTAATLASVENFNITIYTNPASENAFDAYFTSKSNKDIIDSITSNLLSSGPIMQGAGIMMDASNSSSGYNGKLENNDINNAKVDTIYFFNQCLKSLTNYPEDESGASGVLVSFAAVKSSTYAKQTMVQMLFTASNVWFRLKYANSEFGNWMSLMGEADQNDLFNNEKYFLNTCVDKTKAKLEIGDKFLVIGDSIANMSWPSLVASATNTDVKKSTYPGAGFVHKAGGTYDIERLVDDVTAANWSGRKIVFVAAGINDASFFIQDNITYSAVKTAVQTVITKIKNNTQSAAHIVFITPIRKGDTTAAFGERLSTIAGIICYVALTNGCSVINGFDFPIPLEDAADGLIADLSAMTTVNGETVHDNVHPNSDYGQPIYAQSVINAIAIDKEVPNNIKDGAGEGSIAEGSQTTASGSYSHAEGNSSTASAYSSHAEGGNTTASGSCSHAEGAGSRAIQNYSHAEGGGTTASGEGSHAEGGGTTASGDQSHAEGGGATASGVQSHAEGGGTTASGSFSHAEGNGTMATHKAQHVFGENNAADGSGAAANARGNYVEIVGNGASSSSRSNARTLDWNGNEALAGSITLGKGTADEVTVTAAQMKALLALL